MFLRVGNVEASVRQFSVLYADDVKCSMFSVLRDAAGTLYQALNPTRMEYSDHVLNDLNSHQRLKMRLFFGGLLFSAFCHQIRGCIQKFSDWPPGARTANGTALCH
jgi:hypothetical protein